MLTSLAKTIRDYHLPFCNVMLLLHGEMTGNCFFFKKDEEGITASTGSRVCHRHLIRPLRAWPGRLFQNIYRPWLEFELRFPCPGLERRKIFHPFLYSETPPIFLPSSVLLLRMLIHLPGRPFYL